jgi:hypothetical protein
MPDTLSTDGLLFIVRTRLLTFTPSGTDTRTLADRIGSYNANGTLIPRVWLDTVPDDVTTNKVVASDSDATISLWGLMKLVPAKQAGDDGRFIRRGEIVVQLFGRPRRAAAELSGCADVCEQALFQWVNYPADGGYIRPLSGLTRAIMPYDNPKDRELGEIDLRVNISYVPQFLSQYSS